MTPALEALAAAVKVAVAVLFLYAAATKFTNTSVLRPTLESLGSPKERSALYARAVVSFEVAIAAGATGALGNIAGPALLALAALGFLLVGARGLRSSAPIECSCFGAANGAILGWRQVLLAGLLAMVAALVAMTDGRPSGVVGGLALLTAGAAGAACLFVIWSFQSFKAGVGYRVAVRSH